MGNWSSTICISHVVKTINRYTMVIFGNFCLKNPITSYNFRKWIFLLNKHYWNGMPYLSKVWFFVGERAAELQAVKVGGWKKKSTTGLGRISVKPDWVAEFFFNHPNMTAGSLAALWPKEIHSTSLERSKPYLTTQTLYKSLAAILWYFISIQNTHISIVLI